MLAQEFQNSSQISREDTASKHVTTGRRGRVVVLPDIAHRTYVDGHDNHQVPLLRRHSLQALVFYLYTDEVTFAPLRSQNKDRSNETGPAYGAPLCSPKSMYRVADKVSLNRVPRRSTSTD